MFKRDTWSVGQVIGAIVGAVAILALLALIIYSMATDQTIIGAFKDIFNIGQEVVEEVLPPVEEAVETSANLIA